MSRIWSKERLGAAFLVYSYPLRMTGSKLAGTDLPHAIRLALVACASYWVTGDKASGKDKYEHDLQPRPR